MVGETSIFITTFTMSTRSYIAHETDHGFEGAYCHWDGYPDNNGRILLKHYCDPGKIAKLVSLGDMSSLGSSIGSKHDFMNRPENVTTYYGRDRGEIGVFTKARQFQNLAEVMRCAEGYGCEYLYLHEGRLWQYAERGDQYFGMNDGTKLSEFKPVWMALVAVQS